jgi:hypothetical protein
MGFFAGVRRVAYFSQPFERKQRGGTCASRLAQSRRLGRCLPRSRSRAWHQVRRPLGGRAAGCGRPVRGGTVFDLPRLAQLGMVPRRISTGSASAQAPVRHLDRGHRACRSSGRDDAGMAVRQSGGSRRDPLFLPSGAPVYSAGRYQLCGRWLAAAQDRTAGGASRRPPFRMAA